MADADIDDIFGEEPDHPPSAAEPTGGAGAAAAGGDSDDDGVVGAPSRKRVRLDEAGTAAAGGGAGSDSSSSDSSSDSDSDSSSGSSSSSDSDSDSSSSSSSSGSDSDSGSARNKDKKKGEAPKRRMMNQKQAAKNRVRAKRAARLGDDDDAAASAAAAKRAAAAAAAAGGKKKTGDGGDSDAYDSEPEEGPTADDEAFIDAEDDHADILDEYNKEAQDFRDDRPLPKKKGRAKKRAAGGDEEGEDGGEKKAVAGGKRKRGAVEELSEEDRARIVRELLNDMKQAAAEDRRDRAAGKPAAAKLRMLPRVKATAANGQLQTTLLEGPSTGSEFYSGGDNPTLLSVLRDWLRPLPGADLPVLAIREAVYDLCDRLPIGKSHLESSRLGAVLFALSQHPAELPAAKEKLGRMIERFSRAIFAKRDKYRGNIEDMLETQAKLGLVSASVAPTRPAATAGAASGSSSVSSASAAGGAAATISDADFGRLLGDEIAASLEHADGGGSAADGAAAAAGGRARKEPIQRHARIPAPIVLDFVVRPERAFDSAAAPAGGGGATGAGGGSGGGSSGAAREKAGLAKRMMEVRRAVARKPEAGIKISIEGRGATY